MTIFIFALLRPSRWPAGNPETGYLDTDGSPTKTNILELGRQNRDDRYWKLNFGMRQADELYSLQKDNDCEENLANDTKFRFDDGHVARKDGDGTEGSRRSTDVRERKNL